MKTQQTNCQNIKKSLSFKCQQGFVSVGLGLGLAALYGGLGTILVANHEMNKSEDFISKNNIELQKTESRNDDIEYESSFVVGEITTENLHD